MKTLMLLIVAAAALAILACGSEEEPPTPPLPPVVPTQATTSAPPVQAAVAADAQATAEAAAAATAIAASVQATVAAQAAAATSTPEPTATPAPPTSTPEPTATPEPPTNTPEPTPEPPTSMPAPTETPAPPTNTPEPTAAPPTSTPEPTATNTPRPTLTPTATPLPYGFDWDNPVPMGESFVLQNNEGITLRVREDWVFWARQAWRMIDDENPLNDPAPYGHEYLLINIQLKGHPEDVNEYDAAARLTVEADPSVRTLYPNDGIYKWLGTNHCGGQVDTVIPRDISLERYTGEENGRRGFICFVVTHDDSGKLVLVDSGGPGAPPEDRRYFSLRR